MRSIPVEPSNERAAIGKRLRAARLAQRITLEEASEATGLSKGFISRVERDLTSISVASLVSYCEVLSLPIGSLFESTETHLVRAGSGPHINLGGTGADERLLSPRTESRVQMVRSVYRPGGDGGPELYTLNSEIEIVHILTGSIALRFSDREVELEAGDTLTFNANEPHSWHAHEVTGAEVLWVIAPSAWSGTS
ncbi:cupin domain-containing protein [Leucobacter sp. UT-8R-CII-1-4]|uniref:helix-turn-helix domain-containing protein n=1 Tax=Leucobacter sp. UT-8R-CII-1-4 TaxID=3040075 RepID=UPI0024A84F83|nr:cupin domain-containing protein [Leucobacter sp. UT-8R-CII-1-4]MDI6023254.1 cupin domain-containing protein [Leucobacter sp. UT-8R-CII-1-4]